MISPKNQNPQTKSNTAGRVTVRQITPPRNYKRDDFFRDLKKANRRLK